jgi:hypothetical protein
MQEHKRVNDKRACQELLDCSTHHVFAQKGLMCFLPFSESNGRKFSSRFVDWSDYNASGRELHHIPSL